MTIKQIEYFLKVCESIQINKCAKELGISQSALSIAIKNLETSLGGALFDRRAKSLILNERGKAFRGTIIPLYLKILEIERNMKSSNMYNISIDCSQNIANYLMPDVFEELIGKKDRHELHINIANSETIINSILDNKCDLGVIEGKIYSDEIKKVKICDDELIIVSGVKKFSTGEYFIDEIARHPWINREIGSGIRECLYDKIPTELELNSILELNSTEAIKRFIKNKPYFACLPKFALKNELGDGIYKVNVKNLNLIRELILIYRKNRDENETFMKILKTLQSSIKKSHESKIS